MPEPEFDAVIQINPVYKLNDRLQETFHVVFVHGSGKLFPASRNPDPNRFRITLFMPPLRGLAETNGTLRVRVNIETKPEIEKLPEEIAQDEDEL